MKYGLAPWVTDERALDEVVYLLCVFLALDYLG